MRNRLERIRLAHITFDMRIGGAERVIAGLVAHTDCKRFDSSIICLERHIGPFGMQLTEKGVPLFTIGRRPGFDTRLLQELRRHIEQKKLAILHCHQYTPYVYGLLSSLGTGAKVIFTEHGRFYPDSRKLKRMMLNPVFSRITSSVTAISTATRDALVTYENFPRKDIEIIYNGIEDCRSSTNRNATRSEFNLAEDAFVLGAVSRLDPIKNHPLMIRALARLLAASIPAYLMIVGGGPERESLERLAGQLGVESKMIFTGFRQDAEALYSLMDVFLLTSFSEGTAMTLLEASAAGLPCIVTDVGGNPEIVRNGHTGFIVPSGDENRLVERILQLFENRDLRKKLGDAARRRFERYYTVGHMVQKYEALYERILTGRRS